MQLDGANFPVTQRQRLTTVDAECEHDADEAARRSFKGGWGGVIAGAVIESQAH